MSHHSCRPDSQPRIAALVLNSVSHDARVLKEAGSLADAGFEISILGIQDDRCDTARTELESGVVIIRSNYRGWTNLRRMRANFRVSFLWLLLAIVLLSLTVIGIFSWVITPLNRLLEHAGGQASGMLMLVLLGVIAVSLRSMKSNFFRRRKLARDLGISGQLADAGAAMHLIPEVVLKFVKRLVLPLRPALIFARGRARIAYQRSRERAVVPMFATALEEVDPTHVHCHDMNTLRAGLAWCEAHPNCRLVLDSHELYEEVASMEPVARRYWQELLRAAADKIDAFITINQSIADEYASRYPTLPPAVIIRNAAKLADQPVSRDPRLAAAAGFESDRRILLYQGGFAPHRGLESLVQAAGQLPSNWGLVMMGWGRTERQLRRLAARVDPESQRIRFIPGAPQDELRDWTSGAHLGIIPYENTCLNHWYCTPNKLWEYPIAGVPILVSPFPELKAIAVYEGVGQVLPDVLTGKSLAALVSSIDDEQLDRMQEACARFVAKDNWDVYGDRLVDLYRSL